MRPPVTFHPGPTAPLRAAMTPAERAQLADLPDDLVALFADSRLARLDGGARLVDMAQARQLRISMDPPGWTDPDGLQTGAPGLVLPLVPFAWDIELWAHEDAHAAEAIASLYVWRRAQPRPLGEDLVKELCHMRPYRAKGYEDRRHERRLNTAADVIAAHRLTRPGEFERLRTARAAWTAGMRSLSGCAPDGHTVPVWWTNAQDLY